MTTAAPATSVPLLAADAVTAATPMPALIAALRAAFSDDALQAPHRLAAPISEAESLLAMPAWSAAHIGTKIVTIDRAARPSVRSTYLLTDRASGTPIALLDGATLTRRRTAGASALAASFLARNEARSLLLLGTGALIAPLIEAYSSILPLDRIRIWGRDPNKAAAAAAAARAAGHAVEVATDIADALADSDIVSAATLATAPLIVGQWLRPGTHVDLIGAFTPEMTEADPATFARARIFVDTLAGARHEAGDLIQAIDAGAIDEGAIAGDLASLCRGTIAGRRNADEITLFKSVGTAIEDLAAATLAWRTGAAV